jgi:hypothetical protein
MTDTIDEVDRDGARSGNARVYSWVLNHLAKFPGRVTAVTFAAGVVVTLVVTLVDGDWSAATIVGLLATLWALFFSVMIYLLTARDTDRVLEQIADLHDQLSTALAAPDEDEEDEQPQPESEAVPPVVREPVAADSASRSGRRPREDSAGRGRPAVINGAEAISAGVPEDLLTAWAASTGRRTDDLTRAWSRDPRSDRQWVLEASDRERWVVFSKHGSEVGVLSLDHAPNVGRRYSRAPGRDAF